ncbi:hypothetical protein HMPREF1218_1857 [Hoylesella pleuritidis F0068]|uniref:Uncharacterized protein n=1 Tax=Hoylesella pleuritidis F0068 TaxID=1081904 RepID=U2LFQ7_9BACT|nr:hypothetical protein HMPREF1218_1857 [Hoylesella pleuritidis F0068]
MRAIKENNEGDNPDRNKEEQIGSGGRTSIFRPFSLFLN